MSSSIGPAVRNFITLMTAVLPNDCTIALMKDQPKFTGTLTLQITDVIGDQEWAELGPEYKREETFHIMCKLTSFAGDQDEVARLTEVTDAWSTVTVAVANDMQLTGVPGGDPDNFARTPAVRLAEVGEMEFMPEVTSSGKSVGCLTFAVKCQQRITTLT